MSDLSTLWFQESGKLQQRVGLKPESQAFSIENWEILFCALVLLSRLRLSLRKGVQGWNVEIKSYHRPRNNSTLTSFLKFPNLPGILQVAKVALISLAINEGVLNYFPGLSPSSEFLH